MPNQVSFSYFKTSLEIILLEVMLYLRFPLSLRNVEDLPHERGVDVSYESVWFWRCDVGPMCVGEIKIFFLWLRTAFGTAFPKWHFNKALKINILIKVWSHPRCATSSVNLKLTHCFPKISLFGYLGRPPRGPPKRTLFETQREYLLLLS